jgi:hypothetical protein
MTGELKKRMTIRIGIVTGMQDIDENGAVLQDYTVNTWGGSYMRMEQEEAILFQQRLNDELGADMDALTAKARKVAVDFGIEMVIGTPPDSGKPKPR